MCDTAPMTSTTCDHALIRYSDDSASVQLFAGAEMVNSYTVRYADASPKAGLPAGISITERYDDSCGFNHE